MTFTDPFTNAHYSHRVSFLSGFSQSLMWSIIILAAWSAVKFRPMASTKSPSGSAAHVSSYSNRHCRVSKSNHGRVADSPIK
jgi:hypothetical protein